MQVSAGLVASILAAITCLLIFIFSSPCHLAPTAAAAVLMITTHICCFDRHLLYMIVVLYTGVVFVFLLCIELGLTVFSLFCVCKYCNIIIGL